MTDRTARLAAIRRTIDALDADLLDLLNRRARSVLEVAAIKALDAEPRYYRPEREVALLRRLAASNGGPLPAAEVTRLFREIVSTCRALEQRMVIGCTTVHEACAAIGHFGGAVDLLPVARIGEVLDAVVATRCDHAVIAFAQEDGASPAVADLPERGLALCGEWYARDAARYVVVGTEPSPPSGDDWGAFVVPAPHAGFVASWCADSNVRMRSAPVAGRASSIVEVALRAADPGLDRPALDQLVADAGGLVLGAFPNAGADPCPR